MCSHYCDVFKLSKGVFSFKHLKRLVCFEHAPNYTKFTCESSFLNNMAMLCVIVDILILEVFTRFSDQE